MLTRDGNKFKTIGNLMGRDVNFLRNLLEQMKFYVINKISICKDYLTYKIISNSVLRLSVSGLVIDSCNGFSAKAIHAHLFPLPSNWLIHKAISVQCHDGK